MKKFLLILILLLFNSIYALSANNDNYVQYIDNVLNKNLPIVERVDACNDIRDLPDITPLTKAQLYALKISARYKMYNIWAMTIKYIDDDNIKRYAMNELGTAENTYLEKVRNSVTESDKHLSKFFLGLFEYATGNTTMGTQDTKTELLYLMKDKSTKKHSELLSKIAELTIAFCKKDTTANDIIKILETINYKE